MSDNKLLNENTVRRFMKLANVQTLTDNFIENKYANRETIEEQADLEAEEPMEDEAPETAEPEMDLEDDPMDDEMADDEMEMGAADISLTEEEAELLIDLGERLKEAMEEGIEDEPMEDEMEDEPMGDEVEEPMEDEPMGEDPGEEEPAGMPMQERKDEIVKEVLKRVTKRILSNRR